MKGLIFVMNGKMRTRSFTGLAGLLLLFLASCTAVGFKKLPRVERWQRFDLVFKSGTVYSNAFREVALRVIFTPPRGEARQVYGFWDGGQTWRARFSPDQPGRWSYDTICSDPSNQGLHHQSGAFLCLAAAGTNSFNRHGPLRLAADRRHFEQADGTPFFWLADSAWNGARLSDSRDWELYARIRVAQKFSAVQWSVAPGEDWAKQSAFTGKDRITVNPAFFQRLDAKVDALNRAGLLSVIAPFWEIGALPGDWSDAGTISLLRYLAARWGANDVAWLLTVDGGDARKIERCKRVCRAVFGEVEHAPVVLDPGPTAFEEFRNEPWVDAFGYAGDPGCAGDPGVKRVAEHLPVLLAEEWKKEPYHPLLNLAPTYENQPLGGGKQVRADELRRVAWRSLLLAPPAGFGYGTLDVAIWNTATGEQINDLTGRKLPLWQESLNLPGAKQMTLAADLMNTLEFWRLVPAPQSAALQPDPTSPCRSFAAAESESRHLRLVYVPEDRTLELSLDALPSSPLVNWINPQTGESCAAAAVVTAHTCRFPTPEPGDWLLSIKAGK